MLLKVFYGIDTQPDNDPFVRDAKIAMHGFSSAVNAGEFLVNAIPICTHIFLLGVYRGPVLINVNSLVKYVPEWFPGAGFRVKARKWRLSGYNMLNNTFENVEIRMASHLAAIGFISALLTLSRHEVMYLIVPQRSY